METRFFVRRDQEDTWHAIARRDYAGTFTMCDMVIGCHTNYQTSNVAELNCAACAETLIRRIRGAN